MAQGLADGVLEAGASVASAAIMWASASVSVSLTSLTPLADSASLSCSAFSMMPLCTTAIRPSVSVCGWALTSFGSPWVAHLVWPMPIVASGAVLNPVPEFLNAARRLGDLQTVAVDDGQPGRVVAPVLEAPESLE